MTDITDITIRPVTEEEYPDFVLAFIEGFADDLPSGSFSELIRGTLPPERTLAAFDGDRIVGTFGGYHLDLTVPGGACVPMEGTTVVTVFPTHRRMGLLRAMMGRHLAHAVDGGYPIAGLWASESDIYGRFGYGVATRYVSWKMRADRIAMRGDVPIDRVRRITPDDAANVLPPVFDAVVTTRAGMYARTPAWWREVLSDEDWMKRGRTSKRYVVHEGPQGPDGYAVYRQKSDQGDDDHADGKVSVVELIAVTPRAEASLWSYLTRIDLCPNVDAWNVPLDDPFPLMVREPRRVASRGPFDALWIRILDVAGALEARTYEENGAVVLRLVDSFRPDTSGTYALTVDAGVASVERTGAEPDVTLDVDVLGALYLGGQDAHAFAAAGRISGDPDAIAAVHRMFRTAAAPWCNQVF